MIKFLKRDPPPSRSITNKSIGKFYIKSKYILYIDLCSMSYMDLIRFDILTIIKLCVTRILYLKIILKPIVTPIYFIWCFYNRFFYIFFFYISDMIAEQCLFLVMKYFRNCIARHAVLYLTII